MHRFFVPRSDFHGQQVVFDQRQAHQLRNVLRATPGQRIIVLDNAGNEYEVVLTVLTKSKAIGKIEQERPAGGEPQVHLSLYQGLLARDKFELVLQKCTEVGVARFVPTITQRTIVRTAETLTHNKLARWKRIITEAAEQSCRAKIPQLERPVHLEKALASLNRLNLALISSPHKQHPSLQDTLQQNQPKHPQSVALLIGPEGGFTDQEVQLARDAGAVPVSLGPRILRTETAAIVAAALILYQLGQMQ